VLRLKANSLFGSLSRDLFRPFGSILCFNAETGRTLALPSGFRPSPE